MYGKSNRKSGMSKKIDRRVKRNHNYKSMNSVSKFRHMNLGEKLGQLSPHCTMKETQGVNDRGGQLRITNFASVEE